MLTDDEKRQVLDYCKENIPTYEALCDIAIERMNFYRCGLDFACPELNDGILEQYGQWCEDNGFPEDEDFDTEDILYFTED